MTEFIHKRQTAGRDGESTPPAPHRAREVAESFGADPERYDRTRPRYPAALVEAILGSRHDQDVLDVGIGTGVSAAPFAATGCRVLGVEVDERMAQFARRRGFEVEVARFEDWDPAGRTFDTIIAGMTWHWIDPVRGAAQAATVLRRGGTLAIFWNVHRPPPALARAFAAVYAQVVPGTPFAAAPRDPVEAYGRFLDAAAQGLDATGAFATAQRVRVDFERAYTTAEWLDQLPTFGGHGSLAPETLARLADGIGAAIDSVGGRFTVRYAALALTARRGDRG